MSEESFQRTKKEAEPPPLRHPKKVKIPRREPSIVVPPKLPVFTTPDKTTCVKCPCFPKEDPYDKNKKLSLCQKSPLTLYELTSEVVDSLKFPDAFDWSVEDVATWIEQELHLPQYTECIFDNKIDGNRLLMLEDPSKIAEINIKDFEHIKMITSKVRKLFGVEFTRFARSTALPPRKPLTHCTWFKSRTGPPWGIRTNWTRCDILRRMGIIMPEPVKMDHWDLAWYQKPDFPKVMFARIPKRALYEMERIPQYRRPLAEPEACREYLVPRKFKLLNDIPDAKQYIWTYKPIDLEKDILAEEKEKERGKKERKNKKPLTVPKDTRLMPKKISLTGLRGKDFLLARRKMPAPKFLPSAKVRRT